MQELWESDHIIFLSAISRPQIGFIEIIYEQPIAQRPTLHDLLSGLRKLIGQFPLLSLVKPNYLRIATFPAN